jgi:hypothetical protein
MECQMPTSPLNLAKYYLVDDVPSAATGGTRLSNILESLANGLSLTATSRRFLMERGLLTLVKFADREISEEQFSQLARAERDRRTAATEIQRRASESEAAARQAAMWASLKAERTKRESDPKFIAKQKNQELRRKYDVDHFVEEHQFTRLITLLHKLDMRSRLSEEDFIWLESEGHECASSKIMCAYHRLEADFYTAEYRRTTDIWKAVSASGHLRKCDASNEADELLAAIPDSRLTQAKLKSAVRTTHGGAMRDLGRHNQAIKLGEEAHTLQPNNFRPCTLMGALNIELGNIKAGHEWYRKAEERGAPTDDIQSELRSSLARMTPEKRDGTIKQLVQIDPYHYRWLLGQLR